MEESIFQPYLGTRGIFKMDREILRPSYIPGRLPHRESHIDQLAQILVNALRGERPSNVLIFGKTGTGKTAVVKYIENEFRKADGARVQPPAGEARRGEARRDRGARRDRQDRPEERGRHPVPVAEDQ